MKKKYLALLIYLTTSMASAEPLICDKVEIIFDNTFCIWGLTVKYKGYEYCAINNTGSLLSQGHQKACFVFDRDEIRLKSLKKN